MGGDLHKTGGEPDDTAGAQHHTDGSSARDRQAIRTASAPRPDSGQAMQQQCMAQVSLAALALAGGWYVLGPLALGAGASPERRGRVSAVLPRS